MRPREFDKASWCCEMALGCLREASWLMGEAQAPRAKAAVVRAIKSVDGAKRHAEGRAYRRSETATRQGGRRG